MNRNVRLLEVNLYVNYEHKHYLRCNDGFRSFGTV